MSRGTLRKSFKGKGENLGEWQLLELSSVTQGKSKGGSTGVKKL